MEPLITLFLLCVAMLVGSYIVGLLPLAFSLPEEKMRLMTIFGAGLLVGTALTVIIPEGINSLYITEHDHGKETPALVPHGQLPVVGRRMIQEEHSHSADHVHSMGHMLDEHQLVGVSLILGFVFMLLVDQFGRGKVTASLGLIVHAAADGIALGAAASTTQTRLQIIVFLAVMLHKGPAAFGLTSFLLHEGLERPRIRRHLAVFSLAAPVMALFTFVCLSQQSKESLSTWNATALALLFSGGTFLYVATVHVLPELVKARPRVISALPSGAASETIEGFTLIELAVHLSGCLVPLFLSLGHSH